MTNPTPDEVYDNAQAGVFDPRTPGLNTFLLAWNAYADFVSTWGPNRFVDLSGVGGGFDQLFQG